MYVRSFILVLMSMLMSNTSMNFFVLSFVSACACSFKVLTILYLFEVLKIVY